MSTVHERHELAALEAVDRRSDRVSNEVAARDHFLALTETVRHHLVEASESLADLGLPKPALDGKLLRPLAAFLTVPEARRSELDHRFWMGVLAVEMVHEASLLHDDILDEAPERRGRPTMAAAAGVGPALVLGDHLLTSAYRAAAKAESSLFLETFIHAVEQTVAGEIRQERSQGRIISEAEYREIITAKSGELFGAALSLGPYLLGIGSPSQVAELGRRLGCLYQMVDDFLDYCPSADRGKIALQDVHQKKWTWPLGLIEASEFADDEAETLRLLFSPGDERREAPMLEGARKFSEEVEELIESMAAHGLETSQIRVLLRGWALQLRNSTEREMAVFGAADNRLQEELAALAGSLDASEGWLAYFGHHAKSFRFASRLFPKDQLERVAGVYAFCRFTDDLVDEAAGEAPERVERRLGLWLEWARQAYEGGETGVPLLDQVMGEMNRADVPFHYVEDLVEGVRMDIRPRVYRSMEELRIYSYRVASVVGGWLTELFGVKDPEVLERAIALGHGMQLTNILRDVGEDLRTGRLYLPTDRMERHGVDRRLLEAKLEEGSPVIFPGYRSLMEELIAEAEAEYRRAVEAIPALPRFFRGPVAVAAGVYQGIHREIRRNGYDNLSHRAHTSLLSKMVLGARALLGLRFLPPWTGQGRRLDHPLNEGPTAQRSREAAA
jgi:phytoene synthase